MQVLRLPVVAARAVGNPLACLRQQLHQPDRARLRDGVGVEFGLLVDHRGDELWLELVVLGVPDDDVLVTERVAKALVPGRLSLEDVDGKGRDHDPEHTQRRHPQLVSSFITPATHASRSSSVPLLT